MSTSPSNLSRNHRTGVCQSAGDGGLLWPAPWPIVTDRTASASRILTTTTANRRWLGVVSECSLVIVASHYYADGQLALLRVIKRIVDRLETGVAPTAGRGRSSCVSSASAGTRRG